MSDLNTSSSENFAKARPSTSDENYEKPLSVPDAKGPPNGDSDEPTEEWDTADFKMSRRSWLVFLTLAVLTLMVALDGTSISVALPVSLHGSG